MFFPIFDGFYLYVVLCRLLLQRTFLRLGSDLEADVWRTASKAYGAILPRLLDQAVRQYKRLPGLHDLTRLHVATVGSDILDALRSILANTATTGVSDHDGYITVRFGLRWHIVRHLQHRLIDDGCATSEMRDDFFETDLGL